MKTLRLIAAVVISSVTLLTGPEISWAQIPSVSGSQTNAQISGTLPNSRAGLMTLDSLGGLNEMTIGAIPSAGFGGTFGDSYWRDDFYTIDAFLPWNVNPGTDYFFSEIGASITEQGRGAGSFGLGYAYYLANLDRLLRTAGYITVDGQFEETQTAFGLRTESLGKYFDVLAGFQIVASDSDNTVSRGLTGDEGFVGNNYLLFGQAVQETTFHNADIELGGPLAYLGDYGISAYAKAYYMLNTQTEQDSIGWGVRGEWSITEDVTFNVNHTHDDIFDNSTWFNVSVRTPDGAPRNFLRPISVRERFSRPVHRTGRIPTKVEKQNFSVPLVNPKDGQPYFFAHLDPDAVSNGLGTFESPYNDIDTMVAANEVPMNMIDIFYVRPRADGTATNLTISSGVARPLALRPNQMLLGSAIDQTIDVAVNPVTGGPTYTIDALDPALDNPMLMNGAANPNAIVYASSGNLISGITFDGGGVHDGIRLDSDGVLMPALGPNPTGDNFGEDLHVRNNTFQNTVVGVNADDLSDGMVMGSLGGHSTLWNNTFTDNGVGFDIRINTDNNGGADDGTQLTLSMLMNLADGNGTGGIVEAFGAPAGVPMVDLTVRDLDGDGVVDPVIAGNTFSNNANDGLILQANMGGWMQADVGADPMDVPDPNLGPIAPFNTFTGNGDFGLRVQANSDDANGVTSVIQGNIIANDFSDPEDGGDGLGLVTRGDENTLAFLDFGNGAFNATSGAVGVNNGILNAFDGVIDLNMFNRTTSGNRGMVVDSRDGSVDAWLTRNTFVATGNTNAGIGLDASISTSAVGSNNQAQMVLLVGDPTDQNNGNLFDGNRDAGIAFRASGFAANQPAIGDRSFFQAANNTIINTTDNTTTLFQDDPFGDGILISRSDEALLTAVIGDGTPMNGVGNFIESNEGSGVRILGSGGDQKAVNNFAASYVYLDDNTIDQNGGGFFGGDGVTAILSGDAVMQVVAVNNAITNSGEDGVHLETNDRSSLGLPVIFTQGEDLDGDGILQAWEDSNLDMVLDAGGVAELSTIFESNLIDGTGTENSFPHGSSFNDYGFDISANFGSYHDIRISGRKLDMFGDPVRTLITNAQNGILIDNSAFDGVQGNPASNYVIEGTDINNIGEDGDGIQIATSQGTQFFSLGGATVDESVVITGDGNNDDGLEIINESVADIFYRFDRVISTGHGDDGLHFEQNDLSNGIGSTGLGVTVLDIDRSQFSGNNGNGAEILIELDDEVNSSYDINMSQFNLNDEQGFYFQTLNASPEFNSENFAISGPNPDQNRQGIDDMGDNFYDGPSVAFIPELGLYASVDETEFGDNAFLNFTNNFVQSNGSLASAVDGMVLSVGTNTVLDATVTGNIFSGNARDDFNVVFVSSGNPPNSVNNGGGTNIDTIFYDPIGFLDLDFQNNMGESLDINTIGGGALVGRTETGLFTNADNGAITGLKPANRNVLGQIFIDNYGTLDATNSFSQEPITVQQNFDIVDFIIPFRQTTNGDPIDGGDSFELILGN